jgi:ribosomal protein S18 acetylase RimI-like enzyme
MFIIRPYLDTDLEDIIQLWERCDLTRPWNNPEIDIFRKAAKKDDLFLVAVKDQQIIATLMGGYDGHRGGINYLAVHPHHQRNGVATALIQQLEKRLTALGCPELQLLIAKEFIDIQNFYEQLGYEEQEVVCLSKRLIPDQ